MVWIKICGITNIYDAKKISDLGADALGFVLSTESLRRISEKKAEEIITELKDYCLSTDKKVPFMVGVFVNEKVEKIVNFIKKKLFDLIQFSGDEEPEYLNAIKKYNKSIKIIKAIRVSTGVSKYPESDSITSIFKMILPFKESADFFLMDTLKKGIYGGTGKSYNWDYLKDFGNNFPVIIAGGLDADNVGRAIEIIKPFGVDASSRLEEHPGKKDIKKTEDFFNAVRSV
ncbi:MAG: phosphoribosylanthranilate isomerase [Actinobacteria bacterium]|nr:phosphoribosylanthranilate isomerase [Actinomycetota bacterium]